MSCILASDNLKEFVHRLSTENYKDIGEMNESYLKNFKLIADDIKLGQAAAIYIAPKTPHNPEGLKSLNLIFINPNGFSDEVYERNYGTGEGGTITLTFNPVDARAGRRSARPPARAPRPSPQTRAPRRPAPTGWT